MDKFEELLNSLESEEKESRQNIILKYTKKWYWFAIFSLLGVCLGYVAYMFTPPSYQVQSRLLIPSEENNQNTILPFDNSQNTPKLQKIENQIGILQSFSLYKKAIENLNWQTSFYTDEGYFVNELYENKPFDISIINGARNIPGFKLTITALNDSEFEIDGEGKTIVDGIKQSIKFKEQGNFNTVFKNKYFDFILNRKNCIPGKKYYMVFNDFNKMTQDYMKNVSINLEDRKSELINVQLIGPNPKKNADFINELNQVFISFGMKKKNQISENSLNFIDTTLKGISNSLKDAEFQLSNYRKANQVIDLGAESNVIYQKLEEIENEKYLAKLRINYYKNLQSYIGDAKKIKQMINPSVIGITDPGFNGMLTKLMDLYSKREVLAFSVENNNPSLILLEKDIQLTSNSLLENLNNLLKNAEIEMQSMETRYQSIQDRLTKLPDTERKLIGIQRDFNLNNTLYTYMLQKKAEASLSLASNMPQVQIIDPAMVDAAVQVGPNLIKDVVGGFGLGFLIPLFFIVIADLFNTKIETIDEVEKMTKFTILDGIIHSNYKNGLPVVNNPHSGITESFRVLKVNLKNILNGTEKKVICVNSLVSGEGKTFISANLAATLASSTNDKKILLIEGDMRKPKLNILFGDKEGVGLSTHLADKDKLPDIIMQSSYPNLYFIPSGTIPPNPTELLENGKFDDFIDELRKEFDYIVVDNAPLSLVSDGLMTSKHADCNIFIVRLNYSKKREIKEINKAVHLNSIKNAVIVINDAPKNRFGYGNKYWKNGYGNYLKVAKTTTESIN